MPVTLEKLFSPSRRRNSGTRLGSHAETCEQRTLLSAHSVAAEISMEHVPAKASPANYNGNWQIAAANVLKLTQNGTSVTGTNTLANTTVGNVSGEVHGKKLIATITSIGIDAKSTIKVHLTDATHFTGKRHYFINGQNEGVKVITGVKT